MLINSRMSRTLNGRCSVCGADRCGCGGPSKVVAVDERMTAAGKGPLRSYDLGRGVSIQLTEDAARARGLLPPKAPEPPKDKMRRPGGSK
jgi:hypothetical protein